MSFPEKSKFNIGDIIICKDLENRPTDARFDLFEVKEINDNKVVARSSKGEIEIPLSNLDKYDEVFNLSWFWKYQLDNIENYTSERYNYKELDRFILFESAEPLYNMGFATC